MPALTVYHRKDCTLPHNGPGLRARFRWFCAAVRCSGKRPPCTCEHTPEEVEAAMDEWHRFGCPQGEARGF